MNEKLNSGLLNDRTVKRETVKMLKKWCHEWEKKEHVLVVLRIPFGASATKSMLDVFNTTNAWSGKEKDECKRTCDSEECKGMKEWKGHVLQPLTEQLMKDGVISTT